MSQQRYTPGYKDEAVRRVLDVKKEILKLRSELRRV
jgi:hypothetical protein